MDHHEIESLIEDALHHAEILTDEDGTRVEHMAGSTLGWLVSVPPVDFDPRLMLEDYVSVLVDRLIDHVIGQMTRAQRRELLACAELADRTHLLHHEPTVWSLRTGAHRSVRVALERWRCIDAAIVGTLTTFGRRVAREIFRRSKERRESERLAG